MERSNSDNTNGTQKGLGNKAVGVGVFIRCLHAAKVAGSSIGTIEKGALCTQALHAMIP